MMSRSIFAFSIACLSLAAGAQPMTAQTTFTLDGTGTRVSYEESPGLTALAVSPGFQLVRSWQSLTGNGTYAQFPDGSWSLRGQMMGSAFTPSLSRFRGELAASVSGTLYQDNNQNAQYLGNLRLHWLGARAGAWIGGGIGDAWNGLAWRGVRKAEIGGWMRRGAAALSATVSPTAIGDSLRYLDWEGALQVSSGALELVASSGLRHWTSHSGATGPWWGMVSATYWLGPHVALVGSGGSYPADYAQGLPNGTYASLGIRLATSRPGVTRAPRLDARELVSAEAPQGLRRFSVRRVSGNRVRLTVSAASAGSVEIMGDFTGWNPVALTRVAGGQWAITLPIPPGGHRMNVRMDGGSWDVPPGVPSLEDEFSGVVGLLVLE